jgi:molybdopterin-binding protein
VAVMPKEIFDKMELKEESSVMASIQADDIMIGK